MTLDPNDARLTAYALGELDAREAALVEAELGQSPEAARALVEIRRTTELIRAALKTEAAHAESAHSAASAELTAAARAKIYAAADGKNGQHAAPQYTVPLVRPVSPRQRMRGWLRQHKVAVGLIAGALCVTAAVLVPTAYTALDVAQQTSYPAVQTPQANEPSVNLYSQYVRLEPANGASRESPVGVETYETQSGRLMLGVGDNSNSGVAGEGSIDGSTVGGQLPPSAPAAAPTESMMHLEMRPYAEAQVARRPKDSKSTPDSYGFSVNGAAAPGQQMGDKAGGEGRGIPSGSPGDGTPQGRGVSSSIDREQLTGGSGANKPISRLNEKQSGQSDYESLAIIPYDHEGKKSDQLGRDKQSKGDGDVNGASPAFGESMDLAKLRDQPVHSTEDYARIVENQFQAVTDQPLSTFSIDVDTASYSNVRRFLNQGSLPPPSAVRIEELINYFQYGYAPPKEDAADPFAAHADVTACPWAPQHRLVRIGIKGREIAIDKRPACNLVFLVDVSGSMNQPNKLPLVKEGLRMLVEKLGENDSVAIVVYAGASGLALPATNGAQKRTILAAIDKLEPGGSTNGASGIQLAYETAVAGFLKGGANRVILATDGDFNVGVTDQGQLVNLIEEKAKSGVFLSVLGFGMGNLKDSTLEKLSDKGNGNYAYIDSSAEARKVLVEQLSGTLVTIAKDVKIQIEFNPAKVLAYRLIGYENRMLAKEDFNDDKKDAGEIGAGHTVTALYEVVPVGVQVAAAGAEVDPLEYQDPPPAAPKASKEEDSPKPAEEKPAPGAKSKSQDLLMLKLRYKAPDGDTSKLLKYPVQDNTQSIGSAGDDCELAAAVAAFGMQLRRSAFKGTTNYPMILELAEGAVGEDKDGYRREFVELVKKAQALGR